MTGGSSGVGTGSSGSGSGSGSGFGSGSGVSESSRVETVQLRVAGVASTLPNRSRARTLKVWSPSGTSV